MQSTKLAIGAAILAATATLAYAAGPPMTPQAIDTTGLPELGDEWLSENPYRAEAADQEVWFTAVEIGASGYNQNCARCHGIQGVSGGLAPDLRYLEASAYDDEWYIERFRSGVTQNGTTKMPAFGELLGQEAAWAIRTYVESRADDAQVVAKSDALKGVRDQLARWADDPTGADPDAVKAQLDEIAATIDTLSGAPQADSVAWRASLEIDGSQAGYSTAADTLTVGLSAAE
ncbi:cytochrome c-550 PedF [Maribius pontilimi]|uniref:Cytochrome c-550 PedF n=1 Tax=Palleronia pontilimi TaxID=1964209 RepID=A0A934I7M3_9RHOB|nr:cytochrome c-550 PedF [Palleronia pontilimi]MBJ3761738.1 cytochrome c-550 PedF [Palleronia pontilimi]